MPYFVVQEHHSKKLHYDFRLEIDGVLKSWAVPKGPSMSLKDKRLAVMVEDHPLEYGTFEGIIPSGFYGAWPVLVWDSGDYELISKDMVKGKIEFLLKGKKLMGSFILTRLRGKDKEWLMIKKSDGHARPSYIMISMLTNEKLKSLGEKVPPCDTE